MNKECEIILKDYITPNIATAIKGVLTLGIYSQEMVLHNMRVHNQYLKCIRENVKISIK